MRGKAETEEKTKRERMLRQLLKGAEIGVWEGMFSRLILEICQPAELHLIDPWLYMPEFVNTGFGRKKNENRIEELFHEVSDAFKDDPSRDLRCCAGITSRSVA